MTERTNVTTFVACDRVIEEHGSHKKTIIGIFQNFNFQTLPSRFNMPWFIAAQIQGVPDGAVDITVNVVHDETQAVVFAAGAQVPAEHPENVDLVLPAHGTEFHKEGKYVATININGAQGAYFVLSVSLIKKQLS